MRKTERETDRRILADMVQRKGVCGVLESLADACADLAREAETARAALDRGTEEGDNLRRRAESARRWERRIDDCI